MTSGIYMPKIPKIPKLDFRVEGVFTNLPGGTAIVQQRIFLLPTTTTEVATQMTAICWEAGLGGKGKAQRHGRTTGSPRRSKLQLHFRHQKVSNKFIPSGGNLTDADASADLWVRSRMSISSSIQYERWSFPVIAPRLKATSLHNSRSLSTHTGRLK